jgi:diguanylate cyclase (GGDEF)-like protein
LNLLKQAWHRMTAPHSGDPDQARHEYLAKTILAMVAGSLLLFTIPILAGWALGVFDSFGPIMILIIDIPVGIACGLAYRGRWQAASLVPILIFFLLGAYGSHQNGLIHTFLLAYVTATMLASMILGTRWQWIVMASSILVHILLGSTRDRASFEEILTYTITICGFYTGIALLQWFATSQLQRALAHVRQVAVDLHEEIAERKRAEAALARNAAEMAALYEASIEINAQTDLPILLQAIIRRAARLMDAANAGIFLFSPGSGDLKLAIHLPEEPAEALLEMETRLAGRAAQSSVPLAAGAGHGQERIPGIVQSSALAPQRPLLGVPLRAGGRAVGVLIVEGGGLPAFGADQIRLAGLFADQAAIAIENARLYAEVQRLATVDELTGLLNRRGLAEFGQREYERASRFARPLAAIFLDIDHFKKVNDTYGHPVGDQVLRELARRLRDHTREVDLAVRFGGEEFVILMPETGPEAAIRAAERVRVCMTDLPVRTSAGEMRVTLSLGVAQIEPGAAGLDALIDRADRAVLEAKKNGRNRVEFTAYQARTVERGARDG